MHFLIDTRANYCKLLNTTQNLKANTLYPSPPFAPPPYPTTVMSTPAKRASPSAPQASAYKKPKLDTNWWGNVAKEQADAVVAELEAKLARARADGEAAARAHAEEVAALKAKLDRVQRARAECVAAALAHAEEVAALKAKLDRVLLNAARYQRERDEARVERASERAARNDLAQQRDDAARVTAAELKSLRAQLRSAEEAAAQAEQERLALAKERDDSQAAVVLLDRRKAELVKQLEDATKWRDNYKGLYLDSRADFLDFRDKLEDATKERDEFEEKYKSYKKKTLNRDKKLAEALEQCKTARELGRREAAADAAAATARADSAVASLQAELAKSKSLEEENEGLKKQLDTAKERLGQIAAFQRQQARMRAMMMNSGFMSLGDAAFPAVPAGEPQQVLTVD